MSTFDSIARAISRWLNRLLIVLGPLVFLGMTQSSAAAVSYVQGSSGTPSSASIVSVTYASAQKAGDLNVVFVGWDDATSSVQSITDTSGNTYVTAAGPFINPGSTTGVVYYAQNIVGATAAGNTVTVTFSNSVSYPDVRVLEYSGLSTSNVLDGAISSYGTGPTLNSGSLTTKYPNDLLVASGNVQHEYIGGAGTGYVQVLTSQWNIVEDAVVTAIGSYSATSQDNSGYWVMQLVAFKAAATGDTTPPTAPTGLSASPASSQISLSWTASTDNVGVVGYLVERCQDAGCTNFVQVGTPTTTTYSDTGLAGSRVYGYRVRAYDEAGNFSGYSSTSRATTPAAPPAYVQGNSGTPGSGSTVNVTYTGAQAAGDFNVVFVGWDTGTCSVQSITDTAGNNYVAAAGPFVNPGNITQVVYYAPNIASASAGANTVTVNLSNSVSYPDVRILEFSGVSTSNPLDVAVSAYGTGPTLNSGSLTTTTAGDLLVAGGYVQHQYTGGAGTGYTAILESQWNLVEDAVAASPGVYSATSTDSSGYWVMQLFAFRAKGEGNLSPPTAPTNLTATATSSAQISLSWTASTAGAGIASYTISRCLNAGCDSFSPIGTATTTGYTDSSVGPSSYYTYEVLATDNNGNSSPESAPAGASTDLNGESGSGGSGGSSGSGGGSGSGSGSSGGSAIGAGATTSTYVYDSHGRLVTVTTASGVTIHYSYDAAGHLIGISNQ